MCLLIRRWAHDDLSLQASTAARHLLQQQRERAAHGRGVLRHAHGPSAAAVAAASADTAAAILPAGSRTTAATAAAAIRAAGVLPLDVPADALELYGARCALALDRQCVPEL